MVYKRTILPFVTLFFVLVLWELVTRFSGWSRNVFPGPIAVLTSMGELMANGTLLKKTFFSSMAKKNAKYNEPWGFIPEAMLIAIPNNKRFCSIAALFELVRKHCNK